MPEPQSLLRPLRSDSLKPRPSTQAVWEPRQPVQTPSAPTPEPAPLSFPDAAPQADASEEEQDSRLELAAAIKCILEDDGETDEESLDGPDALLTAQMPQPVFVPLFDEEPPQRKRKGWPWLVLIVLAALGTYAAWHFGYLPVNLP